MNEGLGQRQQRRIWLTVFALIGVVSLIVSLFVRQFVTAERLDPEWLRARGAIIFEQPRELEISDLIDDRGQRFNAKSFSGQWDLLFFGYTYCPDFCPTTLAILKQTMALLPKPEPSADLKVYMVSVDPVRDTAERLAQYMGFFSSDFTGLTGEFLDLHRFASTVNIAFRKAPVEAGANAQDYLIDHSTQLVLINPSGQHFGFLKPPFDAERLAETLSAIIRTY